MVYTAKDLSGLAPGISALGTALGKGIDKMGQNYMAQEKERAKSLQSLQNLQRIFPDLSPQELQIISQWAPDFQKQFIKQRTETPGFWDNLLQQQTQAVSPSMEPQQEAESEGGFLSNLIRSLAVNPQLAANPLGFLTEAGIDYAKDLTRQEEEQKLKTAEASKPLIEKYKNEGFEALSPEELRDIRARAVYENFSPEDQKKYDEFVKRYAKQAEAVGLARGVGSAFSTSGADIMEKYARKGLKGLSKAETQKLEGFTPVELLAEFPTLSVLGPSFATNLPYFFGLASGKQLANKLVDGTPFDLFEFTLDSSPGVAIPVLHGLVKAAPEVFKKLSPKLENVLKQWNKSPTAKNAEAVKNTMEKSKGVWEEAFNKAAQEGVVLEDVAKGDPEAVRQFQNITNDLTPKEGKIALTGERAPKPSPEALGRESEQLLNRYEEIADEVGAAAKRQEELAAKYKSKEFPSGPKGQASKAARIAEGNELLAGAEKDYLDAYKATLEMESAIRALPRNSLERQNLLERSSLFKDVLGDASDSLERAQSLAFRGLERETGATQRARALDKVNRVKDIVREGGDLSKEIKEADREFIDLAKQLEKRKGIPVSVKDDKHLRSLRNYENIYKERLKDLEDQMKRTIDSGSYLKLNQEKKAIEELMEINKAKQLVHKKELGLRKILKAQQRKERLRPQLRSKGTGLRTDLTPAQQAEAAKIKAAIAKSSKTESAKKGAAMGKKWRRVPRTVKKRFLNSLSKESGVSEEKIKEFAERITKFGEEVKKDPSKLTWQNAQQLWKDIPVGTKKGIEALLSFGVSQLYDSYEDTWEYYGIPKFGLYTLIGATIGIGSGKGIGNKLASGASRLAGAWAQDFLFGETGDIATIEKTPQSQWPSLYKQLTKKYGSKKAQALFTKAKNRKIKKSEKAA